jgi:putative membrane protein
MGEIGRLAWGSLRLRPYVFGFLGLYLAAAVATDGWRCAVAFTVLAWAVAFLAEWSSTRSGIPFGLYHYTGLTRGQELYLADVPFFDSLSFTFLGWASLGLARLLLGHPNATCHARGRGAMRLAVVSGFLMMWLDMVIDPLAVRGDRWFLGRIFYYPEPGVYFGVPLANFAGWALVGALTVALWLLVEPAIAGPGPASARARRRTPDPAVALYYLVVIFNLAITAWIGEGALFWAGVAGQAPLAALVVSCLTLRAEAGPPDGGGPARVVAAE